MLEATRASLLGVQTALQEDDWIERVRSRMA